MIPIDLTHAPSARKPGAKATQEQVQCYKESKKQLINRQASALHCSETLWRSNAN